MNLLVTIIVVTITSFQPKHPPDEYAKDTHATGGHFGIVVHVTNIYCIYVTQGTS